MSESVLKNIEKELPKLQAELLKMKEAIPKSEALNSVIDYVLNIPEPFYSGAPNNAWSKPIDKSCCTIS